MNFKAEDGVGKSPYNAKDFFKSRVPVYDGFNQRSPFTPKKVRYNYCSAYATEKMWLDVSKLAVRHSKEGAFDIHKIPNIVNQRAFVTPEVAEVE